MLTDQNPGGLGSLGAIQALAHDVLRLASARGLTVATAESLSGGLVAARIADVPGASQVLRGGVIAYANAVKSDVLGVPVELLDRVGSVDADVAVAMAEGARAVCGADVAVSTTGVAGPQAHDGKAVGTVYVGLAGTAGSYAWEFSFAGDREMIRASATHAALSKLTAALGEH